MYVPGKNQYENRRKLFFLLRLKQLFYKLYIRLYSMFLLAGILGHILFVNTHNGVLYFRGKNITILVLFGACYVKIRGDTESILKVQCLSSIQTYLL